MTVPPIPEEEMQSAFAQAIEERSARRQQTIVTQALAPPDGPRL
jgi:hypothetical protein